MFVRVLYGEYHCGVGKFIIHHYFVEGGRRFALCSCHMRILGIDPGLASTGYGVIDTDGHSSRLLECGCVSTRPGEPLAERLERIHDELAAVIEKWRPETVSLEQLFFCANVRTAVSVAQGRGVAILATAKARIPLAEYTPLQIKQALVGYGHASKPQVEKMVRAILGIRENLATTHAADALAAAICHAHSLKFARLAEAAIRRRK
ncbi:MAG: crossover junction endodeoxyribonuclease RuvC [bacterium]